jgi:hypothetical protein
MMNYLGYFFNFQTIIFFATLLALLGMYLYTKIKKHTQTLRATMREMWAMLFP